MTSAGLGLLLIRLTIGPLVFAHGTRKLFGWFGGAGLRATATVFDGLGYRPGRLMAAVAGICEAGGAVLLLTGLAIPLAGALLLGSMLNAAAVQWPNGLWFANRGAEYPLVLGLIATGLVFTGPGRFSLSALAGWSWQGWPWGLASAAAATAGAVTVLARRRHTYNRTELA
jgi:putative oxidoreductase